MAYASCAQRRGARGALPCCWRRVRCAAPRHAAERRSWAGQPGRAAQQRWAQRLEQSRAAAGRVAHVRVCDEGGRHEVVRHHGGLRRQRPHPEAQHRRRLAGEQALDGVLPAAAGAGRPVSRRQQGGSRKDPRHPTLHRPGRGSSRSRSSDSMQQPCRTTNASTPPAPPALLRRQHVQQLRVVDGAVVQRHRHLQLAHQLAAAAQVDERPAGAQLLRQLAGLRRGELHGDEVGVPAGRPAGAWWASTPWATPDSKGAMRGWPLGPQGRLLNEQRVQSAQYMVLDCSGSDENGSRMF
jgi:hypothetical protein